MTCSICGVRGHNRRTCPANIDAGQVEDQVEDQVQDQVAGLVVGQVVDQVEEQLEDQLITLTLYELEVRNLVYNNMLNQKTEEEIQFISSFLNIEKKEFQLINYDSRNPLTLYISNGNQRLFPFKNNEIDYTFMGMVDPKTIHKLVTFTGYTYMIKYQGNFNESIFIDVNQSTKDNYVIDFNSRGPIMGLSKKNKAMISLLKMDYLLKQMIRLGGLEDDNFGSILDLHQDIDVPEHTNLDLEVAGLPNEFTNLT